MVYGFYAHYKVESTVFAFQLINSDADSPGIILPELIAYCSLCIVPQRLCRENTKYPCFTVF